MTRPDKCFKAFCRHETVQCINGRWTCHKHTDEAYKKAEDEVKKE